MTQDAATYNFWSICRARSRHDVIHLANGSGHRPSTSGKADLVVVAVVVVVVVVVVMVVVV